MHAYRYKAKKGQDKHIESMIYAKTEQSALKKIKELGYDEVEVFDSILPGEEDRRLYKRISTEVYVKYKIIQKEVVFFEPELGILTKNLSAAGLLFKASEPLAPGTIVELSLMLPHQKNSIDCLARVTRIEDLELDTYYDVAIYFLDLSDAERSRLNRFLLN
ncbi:MAG: PilZ domain-containing protein [Candidatus Omnitrophota bacterium]